jgi:hypothetical protein
MHRTRCIFFGPFAAMPAGGRAGGFLLCADDRYTGSPFTLKNNCDTPSRITAAGKLFKDRLRSVDTGALRRLLAGVLTPAVSSRAQSLEFNSSGWTICGSLLEPLPGSPLDATKLPGSQGCFGRLHSKSNSI